MENKKFLRRTTAFIAALSFTYFSCSHDIQSLMVYSESTTSSTVTTTPNNTSAPESKNVTETVISTTPVTSVSTTVPEISDTECTTAVLPEITTTAQPVSTTTAEAVTTPEATTTAPVTTTEPTVNISFNFIGYINDDMKKKVKKALGFDENAESLSIKESELDLNKIININNNNNISSHELDGKKYTFVSTEGITVTNDHLYKITLNKNELTFQLCFLIDTDNTDNFLDFMNYKNIIKHKQWLYIDMDHDIQVLDKGTKTVSGNNTIHIDSIDYKEFIFFTPKITNKPDDKSYTLNLQQSNQKDPYTVNINEIPVNYKFITPENSDFNIRIVSDINSKPHKTVDSLYWCDINDNSNYALIDKNNDPVQFIFNNQVYKGTDFNKVLVQEKKNRTEPNNSQLKSELTFNIIPSKITVPVDLNGNDNKIEIQIEDNKIKFPLFYTFEDTTYYLSGITQGDTDLIYKDYSIYSVKDHIFKKQSEATTVDSIDDSLSFNWNDIISFNEKLEISYPCRIKYEKLLQDSNKIEPKGIKRNQKYQLPLIKYITKTPTFFTVENTTGKCIVLYKSNQNSSIFRTELGQTGDFSFTPDKSTIYEILAVTIQSNDEINELPIFNRHFYYDLTKPTVVKNSIKLSKAKNESEEELIASPEKSPKKETEEKSDEAKEGQWFNSDCILEFDVSDNEEDTSDIYQKDSGINTILKNMPQIQTVEIGPYVFEYNSLKNNYCLRTSNTYATATTDAAPKYTVEFNGYSINNNDNNNDTQHFIFKIIPNKEKPMLFTENIKITVTDLFGNTSEIENGSSFLFNYDTIPPEIDSINLLYPDKLQHRVNNSNCVIFGNGSEEHKIKSTVETNDHGIDGENVSGIDEISLTYEYYNSDNKSGNLVFTNAKTKNTSNESLNLTTTTAEIEFNKKNMELSDTSGKIKVTVKDKAGNSSVKYFLNNGNPVDETNIQNASDLIIDFSSPLCKIQTKNNDTEDWFRSFPEKIEAIVNDKYDELDNLKNSGIKGNTIVLKKDKSNNLEQIGSNTVAKDINHYNFKYSDGALYLVSPDEADTIKLFDAELTSGKYILEIKAEDNAGNISCDKSAEASYTFYIDDKEPEVTYFSYPDISQTNRYPWFIQTFYPYYNIHNSSDEVTINVHIKDEFASSGIKNVVLKTIDINGDCKTYHYYSNDSDSNDSDSNEQKFIYNPTNNNDLEKDYPFTIKLNEFKGKVYAIAYDNLSDDKKDDWTLSTGYIHDTQERHAAEIPPVINIPDTEYHDKNGNKLFNHNLDNITVKVEDIYAGIKETNIHLNTIENDPIKKFRTGIILDDEKDFDLNDLIEHNDNWTVSESDNNLITKITTTIPANENQNGNEIIVLGEDNANNIITNISEKFSIDTTKPQVSLSFDNNSHDSTFTEYYNSPRTAYISITERNFDSSKVSSSGYGFSDEWKLVTDNGEISENSQQLNSDNFLDSDKHRNKIVFDKEGRYDLEVSCKDMCDNPSNTEKSGEFILDFTAPELKVTFDNNDSRNGNYFSKSRNAVIEINEPNFDPSRVVITGTRNGSADGFPVVNGKLNGSDIVWTTSGGNVHKATIPITEDGFYVINVSVTDKAGNKSAPLSKEFHIDQKAPDIKINGTEDHKAYNGDVKPVIEISDINIDPDTVRISLTGNKNGDSVKLEGTSEISDGKYIFTADDIPHIQENDDIYSLSVSASDRAGNPASANIRFSVNRFGSTFEPDERSAALNGTIVNDPGDIIIYEINPDSHNDNFKATVKVTKNGSNTVLEEGKDFTAEPSTDSSSGWTRYTYTIRSEYFKDDGSYEITVYSEDKAENKNLSSSILKFSVDNTKPSVTYISVSEGGSYKTDSMEVTAKLSDNLGIDPDSIHVIINQKQINDSEVRYDAESAEISFMLLSLNSTQSVQILASDMAGNSLDPIEATINNLFVSPSSARILMHKAWFRIAAAGAGIVAAAAGAFLIFKKRKKL